MNFYQLSNKLSVSVNILFKEYKILFPNVKILDFNCGLTKKEVDFLTFIFRK